MAKYRITETVTYEVDNAESEDAALATFLEEGSAKFFVSVDERFVEEIK